jgi:hypothetical protein
VVRFNPSITTFGFAYHAGFFDFAGTAQSGRKRSMTERERELESARRRLLKRMQKPQGHQNLCKLRQELRTIGSEMEHLKKVGQKGSPFGSPF